MFMFTRSNYYGQNFKVGDHLTFHPKEKKAQYVAVFPFQYWEQDGRSRVIKNPNWIRKMRSDILKIDPSFKFCGESLNKKNSDD